MQARRLRLLADYDSGDLSVCEFMRITDSMR